ncbi:MAG: hypothetical protein PHW35_03360 [Lentimicrobiaceae bacterium]|jgi:hypothetical protein|nr:hypothetical protein [Lentimicrobiaceae bacterium]MDD4596983.1 hypothetical protein [Lentimicrobiaceae bacterium]MDY0026903.1 hypothetical protein [Lentimicrobium sp.]
MNLYKLILPLVFVAGLSGQLIAQDTFNADLYQATTPGSSSFGISKLPPVQFNLQTGALFSSGFGGGNLFSTYLAPSFNQPLGKKFTLSAGAVISNTTYNNLLMMDSEGNINSQYGNLTTFTLYTGGNYQLNERLTLSGSAYKTINPAFNERLRPDRLSMEAQGVSFGVGYKVNDNLHIGGEIRLQQGNSNFYTPYGFPGNGLMQRGMFGY